MLCGEFFVVPRDTERPKGATHLVLYRQTATAAERLRDGASARAGDTLQVAYVAGPRDYGAIVSVDGRTSTTVHFSDVLSHKGEVALPQAYTLDDAPEGSSASCSLQRTRPSTAPESLVCFTIPPTLPSTRSLRRELTWWSSPCERFVNMARLAFILVLCASAVAHADARRFALIVGANSGGPSRTPLRYAESDAAAFATLLQALGGVTPEDKLTLVEPSRAEFETAIEALRSRMADRGSATRIELVVYYSGHSDEHGLMLGTDRISYEEFRGALQTLPADVRIAILDSCQSGALTRRKGGTMRPPFLLDTSTSVRGQAILTSSSETESAQESDRIRGSFFTHYLLSGLRGAADVSHDRRVTLNEAYQFAFAETLARTEGTKFGPQHPGYEIELAGSGDVVMTDLRETPSSLIIDEKVVGRVFVRDSEGSLVAELYKAPGRTVEIGLSPGTCTQCASRSKEQSLSGSVDLSRMARMSCSSRARCHTAGVLELAAADAAATMALRQSGQTTQRSSSQPSGLRLTESSTTIRSS